MDVVLIPAYEPEDVLIALVKSLKEQNFEILIVNDGSGQQYNTVFQQVEPYATVICHEHNRGKGAALKTGMRYIMDSMPQCENFITCDADGQHKVEDVLRVQAMLHKEHKFVLTMRTPNKKAPLRSRFGNSLSRVVYALLTNRYLSDNQSGLRGFNRVHLSWLVNVENDNYDYEMNVLYYASKKNIYIATLPIEALYINNNSSSHFNPVLDTVRIYKSLFTLAGSTVISLLLMEVMAIVLSCTLGYRDMHLTVPGIGAITCFVTVILNRYVFFKETPCYDYWSTLIYTVINYFVYTILCALLMLASVGAIPLWLSFNISYILCLPLRYYLHKFIFIASRPKE